jgi:hypothetical protein
MQNFKADRQISDPGGLFKLAIFLAASLMTLSACDDTPAPPPSKVVVIDKQAVEIPSEAFAAILSSFEEFDSSTNCEVDAKSLGSMIDDLQIMPAGDFDPARFVIGLTNEEDGASATYEIAFDAAGNMCSRSKSATLTSG